LVNDLNPALLYDASINDAPLMRRKVVRGGSWKDNGEMLNTDTGALTTRTRHIPTSVSVV